MKHVAPVVQAEVWVIHGDLPERWEVPFYVIRRLSMMASIVEAVMLRKDQYQAVRTFLAVRGAELNQGRWLLPTALLDELGWRLKPGQSVESVFRWGDDVVEAVPEKESKQWTAGDPAVDDFLRGLCDWKPFHIQVMGYWWNIFCQYAQHRLVSEEKPVPLFFATLHPSYYRPNWKWIMLSRFPRFWRLIAGKDSVSEFMASGFGEELLSLDLLAMSRKGCAYRYIEVEHENQWIKTVREAESDRLRRLGPQGYAARIMASVKRAIATSIRVYRKWLADCNVAVATDVECGYGGEYRFVPYRPPVPVTTQGFHLVTVHPVMHNRRKYLTNRLTQKVLRQIMDLLAGLPFVRCPEVDVRNGGSNGAAPGQPGNGAGGVLVLPAHQGGAGEGTMLGVAEGAGNRVAG